MKNIAIYGIGRSFNDAVCRLFMEKHFFDFWNDVILIVDADENKTGKSICGKTIEHPAHVDFSATNIILIATELYYDDCVQLLTTQYGIDGSSILPLQEYLLNAVWTGDDGLPLLINGMYLNLFCAI